MGHNKMAANKSLRKCDVTTPLTPDLPLDEVKSYFLTVRGQGPSERDWNKAGSNMRTRLGRQNPKGVFVHPNK